MDLLIKFSELALNTAPDPDYGNKSEADLISSAFIRDDKLDVARVRKALIAQARRDYSAANPSGDKERASYVDVQDRLAIALQEMIKLNESADHWYLREMINSKSLSINACANVPTVQTFIKDHQETVDTHNAKYCINDKGKQSTYFNRQARKAAKEAGIESVKRVCCIKEETEKGNRILGIEIRKVKI
jgi:hypothetical protein